MTLEPKDLFCAKLALALSDSPEPQGEPPSDEDLAALAEGTLDAARRAEVMSYLAGDSGCYEHWVALCGARAAIGEDAAASGPAPAGEDPPNPGPLRRLADWLWQPAPAGALAALAAVALVMGPGYISPDYSRAIDRIYEDVAYESVAAPLPTRNMRALAPPQVDLSTTRQLMESGARAGLTAISPDLSLPGLAFELSSLSNYNRLGMLRPSWRARYELGRLTAVARWQCRNAAQDADYGAMLTQYGALRRALGAAIYTEQAEVEHLLASLDLAGDARDRVCTAAERGVRFLAGRPS